MIETFILIFVLANLVVNLLIYRNSLSTSVPVMKKKVYIPTGIIRKCSICGIQTDKVGKTRDGYWACENCRATKFNQ